MFGKKKKGRKDYPEMVDSIQGSPKEEPGYEKNIGNYNSYPMESEKWPEDMEQMKMAEEMGMADSGDDRQQEEPREMVDHFMADSREMEGGSCEGPEMREWENPVPEKQKKDNENKRAEAEYGQRVQNMETEDPQTGAEIDADQPDARDLARMERMKRRKRELRRVRITFAVIIVCVLALGGAAAYYVMQKQGIQVFGSEGMFDVSGIMSSVSNVTDGWFSGSSDDGEDVRKNETAAVQTEPVMTEQTESETQPLTESQEKVQARADLIAQADLKAAQYDYDGAAELLKSSADYGNDQEMQQKVAQYEASKVACVEISPDTVQHVFVHSLIVDPSRAFDGDAAQDGYNLNMVTVDEFKKIIQSMYDNGYVLVSLHDMGEIDADGKMQRKSIWLPEGKKPVVFSQDDVSYYHSYSGDGFADRLIVDENGEVKNEYTDAAGNMTVGDYDMVPVLDTFIKEHPDFSYRGQKGIVVLTGYNGVLGYRTDGDYRDRTSLQEDQRKWLEEHPDFDFDADVAAATKVADAMKANGWEFANHTWGHISVSDRSLEDLQTDTQKWLDYVKPIVGDTDMIIFAFGSDIGDWTGYSSDNEKFNYLKSVGFDYFCNVDGSTLSWVQFGDTYLRQARMNIDGYRMATNPDILSPLFNVSEVYDTSRPAMVSWSQ